MKVQRVLFNTNYYESGVAKYVAGEHYPVTTETETCVKAGHAEVIKVEARELEPPQENLEV